MLVSSNPCIGLILEGHVVSNDGSRLHNLTWLDYRTQLNRHVWYCNVFLIMNTFNSFNKDTKKAGCIFPVSGNKNFYAVGHTFFALLEKVHYLTLNF